MVTPIPFPEGRWEGGHDLCPSLLGKWKSVVMVIPITCPEGRCEGGHDLCYGGGRVLVNKARNLGLNPNKLLHPCLSLLRRWRSVIMVMLIPLPEGNW